MDESLMNNIECKMKAYLSAEQLRQLHDVLEGCLSEADEKKKETDDLIRIFLAAKRVEGCSDKTVKYYDSTLRNAVESIQKEIIKISTDDLRIYLDNYQEKNGISKVTIDNIRRILSSFFSWLEDEDYIVKSPVRRIHKVKTCKTVKETYSDEALEMMRDECDGLRDLAIIDLLASTGMRVGELVKLNKKDIDFQSRECVVLGKGNKQRKVYFDARTKLHLQKYIESRDDCNEALFVSLQKPHNRLQISGVEIRLRELGERLHITKVHPHKFRRTMATTAIDKGMPIEQVQKILGHSQIDTTMQYAMVNQNNVKNAHQRYMS